MIQMQSMMDVADNTGAKVAYCIKVLGGTSRRTASLGDVVVVSIKKAIPGAAVKAGDVARAVIVRVKKPTRRADGSYVRFDRNAVVLRVNLDAGHAGAPGRFDRLKEVALAYAFAIAAVEGALPGT